MLDRDGSCKVFCGQKVICSETEETNVAVLVCRINKNLSLKVSALLKGHKI